MKMTREEFKKEYLTHAFFFVTSEEQFTTLQKVGIEFGLKDPIGEQGIIEYDGHCGPAENLTFLPEGRYMKSAFWVRGANYGDPKEYDQFVADYEGLEAPK
jgi:hypothetical protein